MQDRAGIAPMAAVLLVGIAIASATAVYLVVKFTDAPVEPVFGVVEGRGCTEVGRWSVARFALLSASGPLRIDEVAVRDESTGRMSTADPALALAALSDDLRAGSRLWVATPAGRASDIACAAGAVSFYHAPSGQLLDRATYGALDARPLAVGDTECTSDERGTTATLALVRVPPGLHAADLVVRVGATGAATDEKGALQLDLTTEAAGELRAGDVLTLETRRNRPEAMPCTATLDIVDLPSGALLRQHVLAP